MLKNMYAIGTSLLYNSQISINVHGQNAANGATPGYRRRTIDSAAMPYINIGGHELGTGVDIQRLCRRFDSFLASQQHEKGGEYSMWEALNGNLSAMDNLFKDSATKGLTKAMTDFWGDWQKLSENPDTPAARTGLLGQSKALFNLIRSKYADMRNQANMIEKSIAQQTGKANGIMKRLAEINRHIAERANVDELKDERDLLLEKLSKIVDIKAVEKSNNQMTVMLRTGQTLVSGASAYEFKYEGSKVVSGVLDGSPFKDALYFKGSSNHEYTVECISGGPADGSGGAAGFRVSIDGGATWLKNADGTEKTFAADGNNGRIKIGDVEVWFGAAGDSATAASTNLGKGDKFIIKPKSNLYWYKNSSTFEDVTPRGDSMDRLGGGSLAGLLKARDQHIGSYSKKLDAFAKSLIWEVNYAHSQGAGRKHFTSMLGTYRAERTDVPLSRSKLAFADRIKAGNVSIAVYNSSTGANVANKSIDFSSINPPGIASFDPAQHSLEDVRDAVNASFPGQLTAGIDNGKLQLRAASGMSFSFAGDTSGLLAGLGVNTFVSGSGASDIAINPMVRADKGYICAGHVNGAGEVNSGDSTVANVLAALDGKHVFFFLDGSSSKSTFQQYLSDLVASVGADTAAADTAQAAGKGQLKFLNERQEALGGVNVKEEMIQMKRDQQNFQNASKMIEIANEMFDTLLALK